MKNILKSIVCIAALSTLLMGCQDAALESENASSSSASTTQAKAAGISTAPSAVTSAKKISKTEKNKLKAEAITKEFKPPFANRTVIFSPPVNSVLKEKGQGDSSGSVALQGFAKVSEMRAVLKINGVVVPLGEGSEKFGVQVIAIQPPKVVLQRGRNRWTASIEN